MFAEKRTFLVFSCTIMVLFSVTGAAGIPNATCEAGLAHKCSVSCAGSIWGSHRVLAHSIKTKHVYIQIRL